MAPFSVPSPLVAFNARFPFKSYPPIPPPNKSPLSAPTLWILPSPSPDDHLSSDVECLKWQAFLALRGLKGIKLRSDISPEGSIDGSLPNLHVPPSESFFKNEKFSDSTGIEDGELLAAHSIPAWVDAKLGIDTAADPLEGYIDHKARIESRAWISLLEGVVHAALLISKPRPSYLSSLLFPTSAPPVSESLQKILSPPPAPLSGLSSLLPPLGVRFDTHAVLSQYKDTIASLSDRLGTDNWFLGSSEPTPLDALVFAYLHCLLDASDSIAIEVKRRVNLVAWEWKVRSIVEKSFTH